MIKSPSENALRPSFHWTGSRTDLNHASHSSRVAISIPPALVIFMIFPLTGRRAGGVRTRCPVDVPICHSMKRGRDQECQRFPACPGHSPARVFRDGWNQSGMDCRRSRSEIIAQPRRSRRSSAEERRLSWSACPTLVPHFGGSLALNSPPTLLHFVLPFREGTARFLYLNALGRDILYLHQLPP